MQRKTARRLAAVMGLLLAVCGLAVVASPATAAPGDNGDDGEGGSKSLVEQLEDASRGYVEAKAKLKSSKKKQTELTAELKKLDAQVGPQQAALDEIASQAYTSGRMGGMSALVNASDTGSFIDRTMILSTVAADQNAAIEELKTTLDSRRKAKLTLDATIKDQQKQVNVMAKKKLQAETALKKANQGADASSSSDGGGSAKADPAPSGSGSGCTEKDPTSSGCLTPRTLHALKQAQKDGFTRYVHCFREQNSGEHPKGRACDFAADKNGFGGDATGASKTYGTNLANYFINNADALDVLYVIWYRRIWLPSSGWKSYSGAGGDPSSDHTNHVHLSVR
ncbi:hypothetical protein AMIS_4030 [Actinoplanes missouriensis 431]|uniref:ARB-07466-like C-terminal domain-containing protein n=1 Tax=Actinoplanes missouriensis (strain ATCC 14538 / DSM 43046 / CBS 188.64 / JCM 3121 / NBRC 102363 / NCIMB 12654 / NRRL B-3342 / UNCC 431) TaxID=512565 RepID=I0GXY6_ACTM4|nr:hypothetical protein AMIS_4030 [Actinoplanes missouriensis 431]